MNTSKTDKIDLYITEISQILPYPALRKEKLLKALRVDVQAAMEESETEDPSVVFGSPREVAKNFASSQDWGTERAGWSLRFFAFLIDMVIAGTITLILLLGGLFILISSVMTSEDLRNLFDDMLYQISRGGNTTFHLGDYGFNPTLGEAIVLVLLFIFLILTVISFALGYFFVQEGLFSTTLGKKIFKLKVVDESGIKVSWSQTIIRNLTKGGFTNQFLIFDLILGLVLEKQNPEKTQKQRGMDILAGTIVVKQK
ncbi:MAG: RDD family protein [Candidatus Hodarchaeales archaeon]|jgi:uncharacterized RDD family membrane protein YckC